MVNGSSYLGGFIGEPLTEKSWLDENFKGWTDSVEVLAGVAHQHPQTAYADL